MINDKVRYQLKRRKRLVSLKVEKVMVTVEARKSDDNGCSKEMIEKKPWCALSLTGGLRDKLRDRRIKSD